MASKKNSAALPDPFPVERLRELHFGNADGHRDQVAEQAFIVTSSVRQFYLNQHSIVVGVIGAGKSTLFQLLKYHHKELDSYRNDLIVPLEEALPFNELSEFITEHYAGKDTRILYQLLWKFNVLLKIAIKISSHEKFPLNQHEKKVNQFLIDCKSSDSYLNIVSRLKGLVSGANLKLEANIADNPISFEAGLAGKNKTPETKINLEEIQRAISRAVESRGYTRATVIIDKIDKFVAGVKYETQRKFITALLEVDDDLSSENKINTKIFLRRDLFERLDFTSLGYDKVRDNVVALRWSEEETLRFLAMRIIIALTNAEICDIQQVIRSSDLSEFELTFREKIFVSPKVPGFIKRLLSKREQKERETSLLAKFDHSIITKVFSRNALHYCPSSRNHTEISIFDFLRTHFLDGNDICTPRYMLIFLKEVVEKVAAYYDENPDQISELIQIGRDYEWDLFKKKCVYDAYISAKKTFVMNIGTVESKWTKIFNVFLEKKANKTNFDYKWIRENIPGIDEQATIDFLSFLQVIGFLKILSPHQDIKKRSYELPILFKVSPLLQS